MYTRAVQTPPKSSMGSRFVSLPNGSPSTPSAQMEFHATPTTFLTGAIWARCEGVPEA